jgi:hypothetical protein
MRSRLVAITLCVAACGSDAPSPAAPAAAAAAPAVVSLRLDPAAVTVTLPIGESVTSSLRAFATDAAGVESDVTAEATWTLEGAPVAMVSAPGALTANGAGGHATIRAAVAQVTASAPLVVKLAGNVFLGGATAAGTAAFGGPAVPESPVVVEYPPDGVVVPANLPPLVLQWADVPGATSFRARLVSSDVLDMTLYTNQRELEAPADVWSKIGATTYDAPITLTVDGVGATPGVHTSPPRTMTITAERLPQTTIFAHNCSHGGLDTIDIATKKTAGIPTDEAWQTTSKIGHCPGCHTVSRDGRRISFTTLDQASTTLAMGTLAYDAKRAAFVQAIAPAGIHAPTAAFNPLESTTRPAMVVGYAIASQNVSGLIVLDPDTSLALSSDIDGMLAQVPAEVGKGATMPTWSSKGAFIVFSAWPNTGAEGVTPAQSLSQGSLVEAPVSYDGTTFHFGAPKVLVKADTGVSNLRPSLDDDDEVMAFMRTTNPPTGQLNVTRLYRRSDGKELPADAARTDGLGVWDARVPEWGPVVSGSKYGWIIVAATRPYGHLAKPGSQLWMFAVDRTGLASGSADPSRAAFWVPGQLVDASYTRAQWPRTAQPPAP